MKGNNDKLTALASIFKQNVVKFIDELIIKFPSINSLLLLRIMINDTLEPIYILEKFSITIDQGGNDMIISKNEKIFMPQRNGGLFNIPAVVNPPDFYEMYSKLSSDEQDTVWQWMETFRKICEKYIKLAG
jgi:hypothetical protein